MARRPGLAVEGQLSLGPGSLPAARVRAQESQIVVELPDEATLRDLRAFVPRRASRSGATRALQRFLELTGLRVEAHWRGRRLARISADSRGGWVGRVASLPRVDVSVLQLALAVIRPRVRPDVP